MSRVKGLHIAVYIIPNYLTLTQAHLQLMAFLSPCLSIIYSGRLANYTEHKYEHNTFVVTHIFLWAGFTQLNIFLHTQKAICWSTPLHWLSEVAGYWHEHAVVYANPEPLKQGERFATKSSTQTFGKFTFFRSTNRYEKYTHYSGWAILVLLFNSG